MVLSMVLKQIKKLKFAMSHNIIENLNNFFKTHQNWINGKCLTIYVLIRLLLTLRILKLLFLFVCFCFIFGLRVCIIIYFKHKRSHTRTLKFPSCAMAQEKRIK